MWGGVPVTADVILKTNYSTLSMSSNFLMGDVLMSKYGANGTNSANEDWHSTVRDVITRKLFDDLLYSTRKEERCAGAVWLLSITMYCGHHPAIQKMLPEIQVCHLQGNISLFIFFFVFISFSYGLQQWIFVQTVFSEQNMYCTP